MRETTRAAIAAASGMLTLTSAWASQDLAFPARGLIDMDEGTVEFWIKFHFDPLAVELNTKRTYQGWVTAFSVSTGDSIQPCLIDLWLFTKIDRYRNKHCRFRVHVLGAPGRGPGYLLFPKDVRKGLWYHCAVSWARDSWSSHLDGKRLGTWPRTVDFEARLHTSAQILLGRGATRSGRGGPVTIDELRISSVARTPMDLGFHGPLKPDLYTTLLLTFDTTEAAGLPTVCPVAARTDVEQWRFVEAKPQEPKGTARLLPNYVSLVTGKFGQGSSLSR